MQNILKLFGPLILVLSFCTYPAITKNHNIAFNIGLNHTGFEYTNSASCFTDNLHIGPNIGIEFNQQFWKAFGYSVGLNHCIVGGKKSYSYRDSVYKYDSLSMTYKFISTKLNDGSYAFNFFYSSVPVFMSYKLSSLPVKVSVGPSFGLIVNQERYDHTKGENEATRVTPIDNRYLFHSRLNLSLQYRFIKKPLCSSIGYQYSHELTKISTILTSRGIQNTNECRLYLLFVIF